MSAPLSRNGHERVGAVLGDLDVVSLPAQQVGEGLGKVGLVFDEEDARHAGSPFTVFCGSGSSAFAR